MGVVDRNILRIAAWEILFNDEVPDKVAIDEALALAKTLCDDDSPAFIHGLLSAVCNAKNTEPTGSVDDEPAEESNEPDQSGQTDFSASEPADPSAETQPTVD